MAEYASFSCDAIGEIAVVAIGEIAVVATCVENKTEGDSRLYDSSLTPGALWE